MTIALGVLSANNIDVYEVALIKQKKLEIIIQVFIVVLEMNLLVQVRFKTRLETFFTHPPVLVFVTCQSTWVAWEDKNLVQFIPKPDG